jgi:hypothetical protein
VLGALLSVSACASLLGIEDIHDGPAPNAGTGGSASGAGNSAADAGSNPSGGSRPGGGSNSGGGSAIGGDAGEGPSGGSNVGGSSGGSSGAGAGAGGLSGAAGAGGAGPTVRGHVIDFWGHKLSSVPVQIGTTKVTTDADGAFTIDNVPAQYDASLVVTYTDSGRMKTRGWVYQGLIRRDPTLQVYEALPSVVGPLDIVPNNPNTLTGVRTLTVALGGPDVSFTKYDVSGAGTDGTDISWEGPTTTQVTAHGLIWENGPDGFPGKFIAYDSGLVGLSSVMPAHAKASFSLTAGSIAIATITGTVAGTSFAGRTNGVFLRFPSNAEMQLVSDTPTTQGFTYTVPSIATATATVAASQGDIYTEYGLIHKDGLLPGATMVNLAIPLPAKALAVIPSTDLNKVSATTQLSFTAASSTAPFVAVLSSSDPNSNDDNLYVVSAKAPFTLPKVVGGLYAPKPGASYVFRVETHGAFANVDAMVESGFLDEFSISSNADIPNGPRTGAGSYTLSMPLAVKIAP